MQLLFRTVLLFVNIMYLTSLERQIRFLTVCTGNTCRSPMLQAAILQEFGVQIGSVPVIVESAGVGERAGLGNPASLHSKFLFPVELNDHRSSHIRDKVLLSYDRIFCMTQAHREACLAQCLQEASALIKDCENKPQPEGSHASTDSNIRQSSADICIDQTTRRKQCEERIVLSPFGQINDPFGGTLETYQECAGTLRSWARYIVSEYSGYEGKSSAVRKPSPHNQPTGQENLAP